MLQCPYRFHETRLVAFHGVIDVPDGKAVSDFSDRIMNLSTTMVRPHREHAASRKHQRIHWHRRKGWYKNFAKLYRYRARGQPTPKDIPPACTLQSPLYPARHHIYTALYPPLDPLPLTLSTIPPAHSLTRYGTSLIVSPCGIRSHPLAPYRL